jgi:hypothetical protein
MYLSKTVTRHICIVFYMEWVAASVHLDQINSCANSGIISDILCNENEHLTWRSSMTYYQHLNC